MIPQESILCLVLHSVRSCHNVGSIFRTADAAGVVKIYLCGETPSPIDRFGRDRTDIAKVSLGAEKTVLWEYVKDIQDLLAVLKKEKYTILALEQDEKSIDYRKAKTGRKSALILGNEVKGIEKEILRQCDEIIEIPMKGEKESLNVAVSAGIALFSFLK